MDHYRQLMANQWLPAEQIRRRQFAQLARLMQHARRHVPFYAGLPEHPRLGQDGGIDEAEWESLPILTKNQVRAESARMRSRYVDPGVKVFSKWGTGSTGTPIEVLTTSDYWPLFHAIKLRLLQWHGYDPRGKACEILPMSRGDAKESIQRFAHWEGPVGALLQTGEQVRMNLFTEIADQLEFLLREAPAYLLTFPSNLRLLLRAIQRSGKRLPSLRIVRTLSEQVDPDLRAECRETLGVPLVDTYGAKECGYVAIQCPEHDHYHVQSELSLVEVLTQDGTPCAPGETGSVVVTPLHAFAMPFLRYDLGDFAEVGGPCPCGRGLPVVRRILGRKRDMLTLPSGRKISASVLLGQRVFASLAAVAQYQVAQKSLTEIEVRLVTDRRLEESEAGQIIERLTQQVGPGFDIRLVFVDSIPRLPGGKFMDFVSEIEPGS